MIIGLLAVIVYLPAVTVPLFSDELHSLISAAQTIKEPSHILAPWMGGALRIVPKLVFMGGLQLWGLLVWPYRLLSIFLYAFATMLVARLAEEWSGSRRAACWAALLFALGFGTYAKPVIVVSNLTMLIGLVFMLIAVDRLWSGRWKAALVFYILGSASHEIVLAAPLLVPFLLPLRDGRNAVPWKPLGQTLGLARNARKIVAGSLLALVALSFSVGRLGEVCSIEVNMAFFMLFPFNHQGAAVLPGGPGGALGALATVLVQWRFWIGVAVVLALAYVVWRGRPLHAFAAGWIFLFIVPGAVLMADWQTDWLEIRYLCISSVGLCLLVSVLLLRITERRRSVGLVLLSLLILWSLAVGGTWLRKRVRDSGNPYNTARRQEFYSEIAALDPRWTSPSVRGCVPGPSEGTEEQ
ncbi:MAG: hypothetical protein KAW67_05130 [Candidatus Eisenbacteria sp.]|nr:hypothetical protein [Candidatus Eisenbacteria bacterium]